MLSTQYRLRLEFIVRRSQQRGSLDDMIWAEKLGKATTARTG